MNNTPIEEIPLEAPIDPEVLGVKPEKKKLSKTAMIIIIIAAVLLLCCCIALIVTVIILLTSGELEYYLLAPLLRFV